MSSSKKKVVSMPSRILIRVDLERTMLSTVFHLKQVFYQ